MPFNIRTSVDQPFIEQAEREAFQILLAQYRLYYEHWNTSVRPKIRIFGLSVSLFGLILSLSTIAYLKFKYGNIACMSGSTTKFVFYAALMLIFFGVFYFWLKPRKSIPNWAMKLARKNFKKIAHVCVKEAKKLVPFEAEYQIDADTIAYYRLQNGDKKPVWTRKPKGIAVHASSVTLFFKKWTTLSPIMVILHTDFDQLKPALEQQEIDFKALRFDDPA
ncbi:MAG: hypothetical protein ACU836_16725 [Gammaproteobacteria bacterium]